MPRIAVLGFGNPLRGDDGVGWRVAAGIAQCWGARVSVMIGQQPLPEWADALATAELAFVVDAALGTRIKPRLQRLCQSYAEPTFGGHGFGAEHLLRLTESVYGRAPETYLLLVPAENVCFGQELSPRTARAARVVRRFLDGRIARFCERGE
jgi:hydrogenase maturation protease